MYVNHLTIVQGTHTDITSVIVFDLELSQTVLEEVCVTVEFMSSISETVRLSIVLSSQLLSSGSKSYGDQKLWTGNATQEDFQIEWL